MRFSFLIRLWFSVERQTDSSNQLTRVNGVSTDHHSWYMLRETAGPSVLVGPFQDVIYGCSLDWLYVAKWQRLIPT